MAQQWRMVVTPRNAGNKLVAEYLASGVEPAADEIAVYIGDNVPTRIQQAVTFNAWRWLWNGVKNRNLLDDQFKGAQLVTGSHFEFLSEQDRRTASNIAFFSEDDIMIGMGADVTDLGDKVYIEAAFAQLRDFALENNLKAA